MSDAVYDFAIVGAGMAGASLAAELAPHASVLVVEAEDLPGYHATGRSAAFWDECYGGPNVVPLTLASGTFLREHDLLTQRGALHIARAEDRSKVDAFIDEFASTGATIQRLGRRELQSKIPDLREEWVDAVWEPGCADIDVAALHSRYLKMMREAGAKLKLSARLISADFDGRTWRLQTADKREFRATKLVNAAGAWSDELAEIAGCRPLGITPYRRTVAQLRTDPAPDPAQPLVLDISGAFYFKPESGRLWLSPHDEQPSPPCDAAPEELAVAQAIHRLEGVVDWKIERVETKWAGLRSFAPDRLPIYGADPRNPNFIWFAGQGGFGIQTAPAAASMTAAELVGCVPSLDVSGINPVTYAPERFG